MTHLKKKPAANRFRFRAWHKKQQKMYSAAEPLSPYSFVTDGGDQGISKWNFTKEDDYHFGSIEMLDADDVVWMQSTGLLDRNGVEIFEGDILKVSDEALEVCWGNGAFYAASPQIPGICGLLSKILCDGVPVEIIGNIYQHPHLLKP